MAAEVTTVVEGHRYDARLEEDGRVVVRVDGRQVSQGRWEEEHIVGCEPPLPANARETLEDIFKA